MYPNIRHFGYGQMKRIVLNHYDLLYRLQHGFEMLIWVYMFLRLFIFYEFFSHPEEFEASIKYDYLCCFAWNNRRICNIFFITLLSLFCLLGLRGTKTFYFTHVHTLSYQVLYDCIVHNTDQFFKSLDPPHLVRRRINTRIAKHRLRLKKSLPQFLMIHCNFILNYYCQLMAWIESWIHMDRVDLEKFSQNSMKLFPNACLKSRAYMLIFTLSLDYLNYCLHIIIGVVMVVGVAVLGPMFLFCPDLDNSFHIIKFRYPFFATELVLAVNQFMTILQCSLIMTCSVTTPCFVFNMNFLRLKLLFEKICLKYRPNAVKNIFRNEYDQQYEDLYYQKKLKPISQKSLKLLDFIYREHHRQAHYIIYTNEDVWSKSLFNYAQLSVPINVVFLCLLLFEDLEWKTTTLFVLVMLIHASTGVIPFMALAHTSYCAHDIGKHIPSMQYVLNKSTHLRMKLKWNDLFNRLTNGPPVSFTFGYWAGVTFPGLAQAFCSYIEIFFLMVNFYLSSKVT